MFDSTRELSLVFIFIPLKYKGPNTYDFVSDSNALEKFEDLFQHSIYKEKLYLLAALRPEVSFIYNNYRVNSTPKAQLILKRILRLFNQLNMNVDKLQPNEKDSEQFKCLLEVYKRCSR